MNKVSILLVDNAEGNAANIESALREAGMDYTMYVAGSGKNGLSILMGDPYHELIAPDAVKLKPNLVILSKELGDISALEFLDIVGKYYSLRDRKFLLLSDSLTDSERLAYGRSGVSAYLQRPLDKDQVLKHLKPLVNARHTHFALVPFMLKTKAGLLSFVKGKVVSMGTRLKVATACIASALVISTVSVHTAGYVNDELTAGGAKTPERTLAQPATAEPQPIVEWPAPQKHLLKKKTTAVHKSAAEPASQKTGNALPKPDSLRIIAIEVPDSISD